MTATHWTHRELRLQETMRVGDRRRFSTGVLSVPFRAGSPWIGLRARDVSAQIQRHRGEAIVRLVRSGGDLPDGWRWRDEGEMAADGDWWFDEAHGSTESGPYLAAPVSEPWIREVDAGMVGPQGSNGRRRIVTPWHRYVQLRRRDCTSWGPAGVTQPENVAQLRFVANYGIASPYNELELYYERMAKWRVVAEEDRRYVLVDDVDQVWTCVLRGDCDPCAPPSATTRPANPPPNPPGRRVRLVANTRTGRVLTFGSGSPRPPDGVPEHYTFIANYGISHPDGNQLEPYMDSVWRVIDEDGHGGRVIVCDEAQVWAMVSQDTLRDPPTVLAAASAPASPMHYIRRELDEHDLVREGDIFYNGRAAFYVVPPDASYVDQTVAAARDRTALSRVVRYEEVPCGDAQHKLQRLLRALKEAITQ